MRNETVMLNGLGTPTPERTMWRCLAIGALCVVCGLVSLRAQIAMPDPRQMSGIPRPVSDLPPGEISVRVILGELSNNIPNHPVELSVNGQVQTARTDDEGRAYFSGFRAGASLKASTEVDGERIESEEFPAPEQGGIRLLLVATDKEQAARVAEEAGAPPVSGEVVVGGQSRIVIEPDEDTVRVYYLLDIVNRARTPVNLPEPFALDMPRAALSTTVMDGSTPQARAVGTRVSVQGPFPPGVTALQVAFALPSGSGSIDISQLFPATLEHVAVIVRKGGQTRLSSPQLDRQQEAPMAGGVYIAGVGEQPVPRGQPVTISVSGLPHHSPVPRRIALALALAIVAVGAWMASRPVDPGARAAERKRLAARREKLLQQLVRLELDHRRGRIDEGRFATRREEILAMLEHVYGALDGEKASPGADLAA